MKARKKVPILFLAWDFESEEAMINKQSKQGWQLVKGHLFYHEYERDDTEYRYRLDYFNKSPKFDEESRRYYDMYADMGWEYLSSTFNGWNYFRKKYVPGTPEEEYEMYTDNESLQGMLKRFIWVLRFLQLMFALNLVSLTGILHLDIKMGEFNASSLATVVVQLLGIVLMETGVISMKRKRLGKKPDWTVGRVGNYVLWFVCVGCVVASIVAFMLTH